MDDRIIAVYGACVGPGCIKGPHGLRTGACHERTAPLDAFAWRPFWLETHLSLRMIESHINDDDRKTRVAEASFVDDA